MESFLVYICEHAAQAHLIIFGLILLAGLNIPISEDLLLLTGGAIAGTYQPEHILNSYLWIFAACWLAAWESYWLGRLLGPKLFNIRWFKRMLPPERIEKLEHYINRFGILTFIVGRFIPGGVRNTLFMSSGLTKMPFHIFIFRDCIGCFIATATLFYLGYAFGEHYSMITHYFSTYQNIFLGVLISLAVLTTSIILIRKKKPAFFAN